MANLYEYYNAQGKALPSVQERQGVAAQNSQLLNYLQTPATRPLDQVQSATPAIVPQVPSLAPSLNAMATASNLPFLDAQTAVQGAEKGLETTTNDLTTLMAQLGGEQQDKNTAYQNAGVDTLNKELIDLQNTARQQAIQYSMTPYSLEGQGRGITTGILRGQEAVKQRQIAIDQMVTNSNIAAKQGNIMLAQNIADRAVAAKYDPIRQSLETKKFILEARYKDLSRADKKLADAELTKKKLELDQIDKQEKYEGDLQKVVISAISQGAPRDLIMRANKAETIGEAALLLRNYLGDYSGSSTKKQTQSLSKTARDLGFSTDSDYKYFMTLPKDFRDMYVRNVTRAGINAGDIQKIADAYSFYQGEKSRFTLPKGSSAKTPTASGATIDDL